uniref:GPS domain-containing protein n=1 Tax=Anopheles culicifacies TaxID=139723 RepID=A0A182MV52_9DIPT
MKLTGTATSMLWWVMSLILTDSLLAERPTFRIIAPEFICNSAENYRGNHDNSNANATEAIARGNSTQTSRQLTIGFQTNGGQRLHYRVKTYFTLLGDTGFISQRHTVGLWRAVRQLEQRVRRDGDMIAQNGQMTIGTDDLLPGVVYSFGVVAVDDDGVESEEQNFTMTYRNADQGASFEHGASTRSDDDVSLLMLGAEKSYADVEYIVTAQLIFCRRRTDYYFRWTVGAMNETVLSAAVVLERSKTLRVPAGSFSPGQQYEIQVSVYSTSSVDELIAKAHMVVNVLRRVPEVVLLPADAIVGIDQAVSLRSYASGGEVMWSCQKQGDDGNCDDTFEINDGEAVVTFYSEGQYHVKVSIPSDSGVSTEAQSLLTVHPKVTPSVKLLQWSQYPAVARKPFELLVSVAGLVPNCYSNWTILQGEDGFAYFDPALLPNGSSLGGLFIRDIEENFLSELVDYGNDTVVKDVVLSIPEGTATGPWKGLEPDVRYKFRLQTVCPEPIDDSKVSQQQRKQIESHWTFVLETNGAPEGLPIEISPTANGTALKTMFKISTGIAKDTERDYPLRYSFWYIADGVDINVATAYEITSAETVLPSTKTGRVGTYVIVCDSRNACTKIIGPTVSVVPGVEPSVADISYAFEAMEGFFDRLNYRDALKCAFELLVTLRNRHSPQYESAYGRFVVLLQQSIAHIRKVYGETTYLTDASIQEFIMQAKPILDLEESNNHELFQQLLELMDPSMGHNATRRKRSTAQHAPESAKAINTKLSLMESLTVSKNVSVASQARSSLLTNVHQITKNYCTIEPHHEYVGQLITLEMNRYRSLAEVNFRRVSVPNKVLLSAPTGRVQLLDGFPETEYYCFGRIYYARDLFNEKEAHELDLGFYEVFVLSVAKSGMWTLVDWRSDYFQWSLDGRRLPNVTCQLWTENAWSSKHCTTVETVTDEVRCNCTKMAYLRISNETEPVPSAPVSSSQNTTTESAAITPVSMTEPALESTVVPEHGNLSDTATTSSWTSSVSSSSANTTSDVVTGTESDMLTLASTVDNTTEPTERFPVASPPSNTSIADNGPSALLQGSGAGNDTGTALLRNHSLEVSSIGYTIAGALAIATLGMAVLTVIYRRRKAVLRLADELHPVPSRSRTQPSPHVRYARFQDEHNMTGDNVSTISDVLTI